MGSDIDAAKSQAQSVINFEVELAKIFIPELERRNEKVCLMQSSAGVPGMLSIWL